MKKTFEFIINQVYQAVPNIDIYSAVGNNDSYIGNYIISPNSIFFQDTARTWVTLIHDQNNRDSLLKDFTKAGYYSVIAPHLNNLRIIVLNTVLFSTGAKGKHIASAAEEQFKWLHQQLSLTKKLHQHALLVFHIPIGIDVIATLNNNLNITPYWKLQYTLEFKNELKQYSYYIMAILPAHIHMDAFQLISLKQLSDIPVSFTPSISPIYGNNPGFKIFSFDAIHFRLENFETYFYPERLIDF